jgi:hypothetical protein
MIAELGNRDVGEEARVAHVTEYLEKEVLDAFAAHKGEVTAGSVAVRPACSCRKCETMMQAPIAGPPHSTRHGRVSLRPRIEIFPCKRFLAR